MNEMAVLQTPWPESASELYLPSDRRLSSKPVPSLADRGCRVVSVTDPNGRNHGFLDRSRYYFFQVAPQLYPRGWVYPVLGIEPAPPDLLPGTLTTRPQRRSDQPPHQHQLKQGSALCDMRPLLWSSGQSSGLQIQRSGLDSGATNFSEK
jgi:hypothetical protein